MGEEGTETRLPKDVFVALAAVAWADGKMDSDEADAIVRAAVDAGLSLEEIAEVEGATKTVMDLAAVDRTALSPHDRLFVYGVACWIAQLDGRVTTTENHCLGTLAELLRVPDRPRFQVEAIARQVAALPDGDRPARYDLGALRHRLEAALPGGAGRPRST